MSCQFKWRLMGWAFLACMASTVVAAAHFGSPSGGKNFRDFVFLGGCFVLCAICFHLRRHYGSLFCRVCGYDLQADRDLSSDGRPTISAVSGRRCVGAACRSCLEESSHEAR